MTDELVTESCEHEHPPRAGRKAPSDATFEKASRLKLLEILSSGDWCVTELAAATHAGMSTVSQQLKVLRAERLINRRRAGKHIYYSLADDHIVSLLRGAIAHAEEPAHTHENDSDA
jgi:ArsR family transcriptional regulator, lead/cadmium/zinc/bismuth-responsive transcriptional repressor